MRLQEAGSQPVVLAVLAVVDWMKRQERQMSIVLASVQRLASWLQASSSLRMRSLQAFAYEQERVHRRWGLSSWAPREASA